MGFLLVFLLVFLCFLVLDPPRQGPLLAAVDPGVDLLETVDALDAVDVVDVVDAAEVGLESIPKGSGDIGSSDFGIVKGTNAGRSA